MENDVMLQKGEISSDDSLSLCAGDLGFGFGLKPGGLPRNNEQSTSPDLEIFGLFETSSKSLESNEFLQNHERQGVLSKGKDSSQESGKQVEERCRGIMNISSISKWQLPKRSFSLRLRNRTTNENESIKDEKVVGKGKFPGLRRINSAKERRSVTQDSEYLTLQSKLFKARQEIENLTFELEACQQQLQSKYSAVQIIQSLSRLEQAQQKRLSRKALEATKKLEQEVNFLQWELELKQSYLLDSEQTWAERFDRVATENATLMVALQMRSDELRKVTMEKTTLVRERDELTAALEVRDLIKYNSNSPDREDIISTGDLILELATLGACQCRGKNQEPCACARAAVDAKRDVCHLKHKLELCQRREEEALLTADVYRVAFEQQLAKNSTLICELLEKSSWKKKFGFCPPTKKIDTKHFATRSDEETLIREITAHKDDIVEKLVGMLSDNSEALAHQRLATKLLAARMKELENAKTDGSTSKGHLDNTCSTGYQCAASP